MNRNPLLALLVQLPIPPPGPQPIQGNVPLAAAYLKLFAQRCGLEGWRIEILPAQLANRLGDQALVAAILDRGPQLVGFTCYLWNIQRTIWITQQLKAAQPELRILLGGPEITRDNSWVYEHAAINLAVLGEGEQTFVDLLAALRAGRSTEGIPGLWNRGGGMPIPRTELGDLDRISSPYVEGILDAAEENPMLMETSRGCRYRCKFCYYPKSYSSIHRMSVGQIEANLRHACQRGVKEIYLLDPTLNQRPDFAGFLRLLAQGNPDRQFTYSAELRAEGICAETAQLLREANFQEVEVGLQSVDPEAQKLMGRHISLEAFERGTKAMLDEGIRVRVDLILGLPGDTVDSVRRGLEYLDRVRPFTELQVFNLSILPGTAFRQTASDLGLEYQPRPPYYVLKTPTLDLEDLYGLMEEAQDVFGIVFDAWPEVEEGVGEEKGIGDWGLGIGGGGEGGEGGGGNSRGPMAAGTQDTEERGIGDWGSGIGEEKDSRRVTAAGTRVTSLQHQCRVDLDAPVQTALPVASSRSLAFTLGLKSADFRVRAAEAVELVRQVLVNNPHTTLQVILEPVGDPRHLTAEVLEALLAASHESLSYLDWFYSLHPIRLLGAKRLVVLLPAAREELLDAAWLDEVEDRATIHWASASPY
ncbi:MAG: radical SAM protein [Planctomycetota bacterium]